METEGMVNQFLSLPIFQVLSKLSYSMYLVHLGVLLYFVGGKKHIGYFSNIIGVGIILLI
ncbi:hypothetical protein NQ314_009811 [Rhamnusium bicolor]|uniref:Acyltransferase 3 domain-containing protein n=1 Tax=Rhamnusium bicolor TaxID=1586634 RepID=A0AAV8XY10_9CUCU|nr:hypothetical protein NQ314_009811 [Rhamnusium bicolor]